MAALKRRVIERLPLGMRKAGKLAYYTALDLVKPIKVPRVPARRHTFIGGLNFAVIGDVFLSRLVASGLTPEMRVLDVGCGQGRMARPLVGYLSETARYDGVEISRAGVDWCQSQYADVPNFHFHHANLVNALYNPDGDTLAKDYRFPFDDGIFDFVFLTSVFTHMFTADVENYVSEIARVLKPGGRCITTWFLLNEAIRTADNAFLDFRYGLDDVSRTVVKETPEEAIAFEEDFVRDLFRRHGLELLQVEPGQWAGLAATHEFQDIILAERRDTL